jgi:hypothetical protein
MIYKKSVLPFTPLKQTFFQNDGRAYKQYAILTKMDSGIDPESIFSGVCVAYVLNHLLSE